MQLDIDFVRAQFDQLHDDPGFVFASNAGGSYVCNQVNAVLEHYNHHTRVQPYARYASSTEAGKAMDRALYGWAEALKMMKGGGKARIVLPPALAYGRKGKAGTVPQCAVLVFEIELVGIESAAGG